MARVRIARQNPEVIAPTRRMKDLCDAILEAQNKIKNAQKDIQDFSEELMADMQAMRMLEFMTKEAKATIEIPKGRVTNLVRVRDFKDLVSDEDFLQCASISITSAKKVLSEKELKKVVDVIQPEPKGPVLKVTSR